MTTINTQEDLLRALRENPEWKEAVRAQILGEELLNLPAALQRLTETVNNFIARQDRFNEEQKQFNADIRGFVEEQKLINADIRGFVEEQKLINADMRRFVEEQKQFVEEQKQFNAEQKQFNAEQKQFNAEQKQFNAEQKQFNAEQKRFNAEQRQFNGNVLARFDRMEGDISRIKEAYTRGEMAGVSELIALDMGLQYERKMTPGELGRMALDVAAGQPLSAELISFRRADMVILARDGTESKYLAVEVSFTADHRDTTRAIRNARILADQTGCAAVPVIASVRNTDEVQEEVNAGQVYWHQIPD